MSLFLFSINDLQMRYLRYMGAKTVSIVCITLSLIVHYGISYLFIIKFKMSYKGAALALITSNFFNLLIQYAYLNHISSSHSEFFNYLDNTIHSWEDFKHILKKSIPSIFQNLLEFWTMPILIFLSLNGG